MGPRGHVAELVIKNDIQHVVAARAQLHVRRKLEKDTHERYVLQSLHIAYYILHEAISC